MTGFELDTSTESHLRLQPDARTETRSRALRLAGRGLLAGLALSVVVVLGGCAAASLALSKKDLDVQTKTSTAIFVDAAPKNQRTVYLEVRSGVSDFDRRALANFIKSQFVSNDNGYRIVDEPEAGHFHLSVYVLNLEKTSPTAAQAALHQGYSGEAGMASAAGALIGARNTNSYSGAASGGLIAGALASGGALVANSLVQDVTYMLVCDVSVKERAAPGVLVRKDSSIDTKISDAGSSQQRLSEVSDRKEYRTRVVTTANKANLKLEEAQPQMFGKTAYALSGFF